MISDPVKLGVAGLGRGFMLTLPSIMADPYTALVACSAPRAESRDAFSRQFGGNSYSSIKALANDDNVEAVYIATPHQMHREHAIEVARAGKHLLVEKPLAISMEDADAIVAAALDNEVHLITGPSHSFDQPVQRAAQLIASGEFGDVRIIQATNYTDFLFRARRPEELDTSQGGGVVFSQAIHQIDIIRVLMGCAAENVVAMTGAWDKERPSEGAYSALINFEGGRFASLTYSGYAHFDSDVFQDWVGELGVPKSPDDYGKSRKALAKINSPDEEIRLKSAKTFGAAQVPEAAPYSEHFGPIIVSCEKADLRLTAKGIEVWGDFGRNFIPTPPDPAPRSPVLRGLYEAVRKSEPPLQSGGWGRASLEICHGIIESARDQRFVELEKQKQI